MNFNWLAILDCICRISEEDDDDCDGDDTAMRVGMGGGEMGMGKDCSDWRGFQPILGSCFGWEARRKWTVMCGTV